MKLHHKILLFTTSLILLIGALMVLSIKTTLNKTLMDELHEKAIFLTKYIAQDSADDLLIKNRLGLQLKINNFINNSHDIEYIFIIDFDGKLIVHTFQDGFPIELLHENEYEFDSKLGHRIRLLGTERGKIYEIATQILKSPVGMIHVGYKLTDIENRIAEVTALMITIVIYVLIFGGLISIFISNRISKPLSTLTAAAKIIGSGDMKHRVKNMSQDEIGVLSTAFNKMANDLEKVISSRNQEIIERKKIEVSLSQSNQRLFIILDSISALVYVTDIETYEILFINKHGKNIWGNIVGKTCWKALQKNKTGPCEFCTNKHLIDVNGHPKGIYTWEFKNTVSNQWYHINDKAIKWIDGRIVRLEIATEITDRKKMEEKLRATTMTDDLTKLLNRRGFHALAEQQGKLAFRSKRAMALIYLDLDGFKHINDTLGHDTGDKVLVDTANILKSTFRESDIISRLGGDEFAVIVTDIPNISAINIATQHLQDNITKHNEQENLTYQLIISSGVVYYDPEQPYSTENLLIQADKLMYQNKKQ